ncbi:MAG: DUF6033 family protein [Bacteroides sp.]|nr:DUF6033 family protein [Eubacterium sp.]MCM1418666.1 DUF6033 family protein [Roseburia sp.]MCM1461967.1 DUF6033 family protein [Bacteroides sp.]
MIRGIAEGAYPHGGAAFSEKVAAPSPRTGTTGSANPTEPTASEGENVGGSGAFAAFDGLGGFDRFERSTSFDHADRRAAPTNRVAPLREVAEEESAAASTPSQNQKTATAVAGYDRFYGKTDKYGSYMIRSTEKSTIYIDPRFYETIKDDPEKIREYSDAIGNMKMIDRMKEQQAKAEGKTVVSRGWYIDADGGIRSWSVVKTEKKVKKTHLEGMRDLERKLAKKRIARRKAEKKAAEKKSRKKEELLRLEGRKKAAAKERLKRKARRGTITDPNDLEIMRRIRQRDRGAKTSSTVIGSGFSFRA